jgi:putative transposase
LKKPRRAEDFTEALWGTCVSPSAVSNLNKKTTLLVASAVNSEGFRKILGICEGAKEDKAGWSAFLR